MKRPVLAALAALVCGFPAALVAAEIDVPDPFGIAFEVPLTLLELTSRKIRYFGTNARNRRELSTMICRSTSSFAPAAFSLGTNTVRVFAYPSALS